MEPKNKMIIDISTEEYNLPKLKEMFMNGDISIYDLTDLYPMFKETTRSSLNLVIAKFLKNESNNEEGRLHIIPNHIITKKLMKYLEPNIEEIKVQDHTTYGKIILETFSKIVEEIKNFSKPCQMLFNEAITHSCTSIEKLSKVVNTLLESYEKMDDVELSFTMTEMIPYKLHQYYAWFRLINFIPGSIRETSGTNIIWYQIINLDSDKKNEINYGLNTISYFINFSEKSKKALSRFFKFEYTGDYSDKDENEEKLISNLFGKKSEDIDESDIRKTNITKPLIEDILEEKTGKEYSVTFDVNENQLYHIKKDLNIDIHGDYFKANNGFCYRHYIIDESDVVTLFKIIDDDKVYGIRFIEDGVRLYQFTLNKDKKYYFDEWK